MLKTLKEIQISPIDVPEPFVKKIATYSINFINDKPENIISDKSENIINDKSENIIEQKCLSTITLEQINSIGEKCEKCSRDADYMIKETLLLRCWYHSIE